MKSFPWDSSVTELGEDGLPIYDRPATAQDQRDIFAKFFSNGVFMQEGTNLQVVIGSGMNVVVNPGWANIRGTFAYEDTERTLALQASNASFDRIDTVVVRWNANIDARKMDLYVVQGEPSAQPVRPELTRNASVYEIGLADVFIPAATESISTQRLTDTRAESSRCGIVAPFEEIDTDGLFYNFNESFNEWFDSIKDQIPSEATIAITDEEINEIWSTNGS